MLAPPTLLDDICRRPGPYLNSDSIPRNDLGLKWPKDVLQLLLETAASIEVSSIHQAQACSAVCMYLEVTLSESSSDARDYVSSSDVCNKLLEIILGSSGNLRSKSIRRLLSVLNSLLLFPPLQRILPDLSKTIQQRLLRVVSGHESHSEVKPAFQTLEYLVKRETLLPQSISDTLTGFKARYLADRNSSGSDPIGSTPIEPQGSYEMATVILKWIPYPDIAPAAANALCTIAATGCFRESGEGIPWWQVPLQRAIKSCINHLDAYRTQIFFALFKLDFADTLSFLNSLCLHEFIDGHATSLDEQDLLILFSALNTAKEVGVLIVSDVASTTPATVVIDQRAFSILTTHNSSAIRYFALSLLISCPSTTEDIPFSTQELIISALPHFLHEVDAKARNDFLSLLLAMTRRLHGTSAKVQSRMDNLEKSPAPDQIEIRKCYVKLEEQGRFLKLCISVFSFSLQPTASYQAIITSLRALTMFAQIGIDPKSEKFRKPQSIKETTNWPFHFKVIARATSRCIGDLLLNPYEDVRQLAYGLVGPSLSARQDRSAANNSLMASEPEWHKSVLLNRAETIVEQSGRSDHADGLAKIYLLEYSTIGHSFDETKHMHLLDVLTERLEGKVQMASKDIVRAISTKPFHGELGGLRAILERSFDDKCPEIQDLFLRRRLIKCCDSIWHISRPILCNDSPEGLEAVDVDGTASDQDVSTKELLSFSWRGLKEASLLLRAIAIGMCKCDSKFKVDNMCKDLISISRLCFDQLAALRHRGAFTTVSGTFAACCRLLAGSKRDDCLGVMQTWYRETIKCLEEKSSSVTRRSAGIPHLIIGLISADPENGLFETAVNDLVREINHSRDSKDGDESKLPQVHALNCLKAIFDSPNLATSKFLSSTLEVASQCLGSQTWAIRNGGLMLFRALTDRLFGTVKSRQQSTPFSFRQTVQVSYYKYPNLIEILLGLLEAPVESEGSEQETKLTSPEGAMLALEIIGESGAPTDYVSRISKAVRSHLASPFWLVRTLASRTYSTLIRDDALLPEIRGLLQSKSEPKNEYHGALLTISQLSIRLFETVDSLSVNLSDLWTLLLEAKEDALYRDNCAYTRAAYLDIFNNLLQSELKSSRKLVLELRWSSWLDQLSLVEWQTVLINDFKTGVDEESSLFRLSISKLLSLRGWLKLNHGGFIRALRWLQELKDYDSMNRTFGLLSSITAMIIFEHRTEALEFWAEAIRMVSRLAEEDTFLIPGCASCICSMLELPGVLQLVSAHAQREKKTSPLACFALEQFAFRDGLKCMPASFENDLLQLQGAALLVDLELHGNTFEQRHARIRRWARLINLASKENNIVDCRLAAAQSLSAGRDILHPSRTSDFSIQTSDVLPLHIALYNMLNDDDLEIREKAADIVSHILNSEQDSRSHIDMSSMAISKLADFLIQQYDRSEEFCNHALARLTDGDFDLFDSHSEDNSQNALQVQFNSPYLTLTKARQPNYELFAEEKQNLFLNPVNEAKTWAHVLKNISIAPELSSRRAFEGWTTTSLELLIATAHEDVEQGMLGWTSPPEVFTFGVRAIYAAGVVLCWQRREGGVKQHSVDVLLRKLETACDIGRAHPFWAVESRKERYLPEKS